MKLIIMIVVGLISMTSHTYAYNNKDFNPWTVDGAFGMARVPGIIHQDGQTAIGRLSLGRILLTQPYWQMGIETGIQSGNTLRLSLPKQSIDVLGGVPIEAKLKPFLDVLIGLKTQPQASLPIIGWLKGGVAYRQLQVDRESVNDLNELSPEIQVGLGYRINEQSTFNVGYQNIFGKQPTLAVNPETETGHLRYIPGQQAVLVGLSFNWM